MNRYSFFLTSSLEKVFPDSRPERMAQGSRLSAWRGTRAAVQLVSYADPAVPGIPNQPFQLEISGGPCPCTLRSVELIPSDFPCFEQTDSDYLRKTPGLYPDLLAPASHQIQPLSGQYRSLWLSWDIPRQAQPGEYPVTLTIRAVERWTLCNGVEQSDPAMAHWSVELPLTLCVGKAELPPQSLLHTEWFHSDCLASYYKVEPLSEAHWEILERFIVDAGQNHGVNLLLTPVFTPPLDTMVGGERPTVQLVDISRDGGCYSFGFSKLSRWCAICRRAGVTDLEIAHLFTQWGAAATPKIMATVDGVYQQIFGWDVPATSPEYRRFLEAFLPALRSALAQMGYGPEHLYFHISDEPRVHQLEAYAAAKAQAADLLEGCHMIDALSNLEFYQQGLVPQPIPSNDHIQPFLDAGVPDLWVYYCCDQGYEVSNRFFSMPSARNRIMGVLMYLYDIKGFLQWGYNFYYSQYSIYPIDPFQVTHAGYAFPSGDAYLVYPGRDGAPMSSLRAEVQDEGLWDLRALQKLEALTDRSFVEALIYENAPMERITFKDYPRDAAYLLKLRERVAQELELRS